ncbi:MAG: hypothetical protein J6M21_00975 [Campylobacter sp.]|nr:hypothetical protein [Campylobacter sp.]
MVISAKNVNFKNVLFVYLVTILLLLFFTFLCSMADIIPNLQYTRVWGDEIKIRNSFGTIYPTVFAAYILYLLVAFSYFINTKNLLSNLMFIVFSAIGCFICLEYADARMSAYSILLYVFVFYFIILFRKKNKIVFSLSIFIYPLFFLIIYYLSLYYNPSNGIMVSINSALSGRLYLGNMALNDYPLTLFGQNIEFIGLGGAVQDMGTDYNYVDSSYLQFYGALFSILSILVMMKITYERIKLYDYKFMAIIFMISLSSMIEDRMLDMSINIYWVLLLSYYYNHTNLQGKI